MRRRLKSARIYRAFMHKVHHTGMTRHFQLRLRPALRHAFIALSLGTLASLPASGFGQAMGATSGLPNLGDGTAISPALERKLGDSIVRSLYRDPDYLADPVLQDYMQSLWQPLLQAARARGDLRADLDDTFAWEILISRERTVNAYALPGGYIVLYLGIMGMVQTRDELASILGHEMSHVTQRHFARKTDKDVSRTPWMIGGMILGLIAASKSPSTCNALNQCSNPGYDTANALIVGSQALAVQGALNYSRDMEREADRAGFGVAIEAGFAPQGFVSMFEKLQLSTRNSDGSSFPYLRTHPLNSERIADMQSRIGVQQANLKPAESDWEALLMAARARLLADNGVDGLQRWQADVVPALLTTKAPAQQAAALYSAALAAQKLRAYDQANSLATQLASVTGAPPLVDHLVRLLRTETALTQNQMDAARAAISAPVRALESTQMSLERSTLLLRAQVQVRSGEASRASRDLHSWTVQNPRDFAAWRGLGEAYEAQGRMVAALRAQAQADSLQYDWSAALGRLRAAQDLVRNGQWGAYGPDHIEAAIVDTRAREVVQVLREQANQQH